MPPLKAAQIDHVALVLDASSSMAYHGHDRVLVQVADNLITWLAKRSTNDGREVRVSIYSFADTVSCLVFDRDVLRLPSIKDIYQAQGNTALMDAVALSQEELAQTCALHGDHAYLTFVLTDGEENRSVRWSAAKLSDLLAQRAKRGDWTVAALVPGVQSKLDCVKYGIPAGNIEIWDATSQRGIEEVGERIEAAYDSYSVMRTNSSVKSTTSLFANTVTKAAVQAAGLVPVDPDEFFIIPAVATGNMATFTPKKTQLKSRPEGIKHVQINDMVESTGRPYVLGNAFYELVKSEKITGNKEVLVVEIATNKVFRGRQARALIGLDDLSRRIAPQQPLKSTGRREYDIFVRSDSVNRLLPVGSRIILFKK